MSGKKRHISDIILGISLTNLDTVSQFFKQIILILQCTKTLETLQHRYVEMTSYLSSSKMPVFRQRGHLTKAFQKEKRDTASQLLKECADRNWSRRCFNLFQKN